MSLSCAFLQQDFDGRAFANPAGTFVGFARKAADAVRASGRAQSQTAGASSIFRLEEMGNTRRIVE